MKHGVTHCLSFYFCDPWKPWEYELNLPCKNTWSDEATQAHIKLWATGILGPGGKKKQVEITVHLSMVCILKFLPIHPCIQHISLLQSRVMGNHGISGQCFYLWRNLLDLWEKLFLNTPWRMQKIPATPEIHEYSTWAEESLWVGIH